MAFNHSAAAAALSRKLAPGLQNDMHLADDGRRVSLCSFAGVLCSCCAEILLKFNLGTSGPALLLREPLLSAPSLLRLPAACSGWSR